ncbi:MAG TPA: IS66 family transposase [Steroidobacteraceae bacterium]
MASVNKESLREEFGALKERFGRLSADGKVTAESRALFEALLMLLQVLMAVFMEKHTPKNSTNSSRPSSQTQKDETALTRPGTHGKGKELNETRSGNTRTVESVEVSPVSFCEQCGEALHKVPCEGYERRTQIDIVFEKVVTHVDAEIKPCPHCGTEARGSFPEAFCGPLQYGAGIKAYALNLLIAQMLSLKRVQQSLQSLLGQVISEATILKYVLLVHVALEQWEQTAIERLLSLPALHVDETSLRVEKKNQWIHVCSGGEITLKFLHEKRGQEAMQAIGVIPRYGGVIIHDCWASYLAYEHCGHGLCGAHLLRELTFIVEADGYPWAKNIKRLLQETCAQVAQRKRKKITAHQYQNLQKRYRNILTRGEQELPPIPARQNGKRGRIAKSDAHNLWERLKEHETAVLLFASDPNVAFTNNRAERDLRMSKVKQKVSGCFRKPQYAEAYCRISSYLQTMANRGYNPHLAIQLALSGQLYAQPGE